MECPGCSGQATKPYTQADGRRIPGIYVCERCGGTIGQVHEAISYLVVKDRFTTDPTADSRARYFDFRCKTATGYTRRHGWYDPKTGLITQVG